MKRDSELLRLLLLEIEKAEIPLASDDIAIRGYDSNEIAYHAALLSDVGFVECAEAVSPLGGCYVIKRITMHGHDFLEVLRDDAVWELARDRMQEYCGFFSACLAYDVAVKALRKKLGI